MNDQYFSYKTTTRVESQLQDVVNFPTIILCARIADMIDPAKMVSISSFQLHRLTIKELLDLTPKENETINECGFKGNPKNRYLFEQYNRTQCYTHFGVRKLLTGELICYQIFTTESLKYSIYEVANAMSSLLQVLNIHLNSAFTQAKDMYIIAVNFRPWEDFLTVRQTFPIYSRRFGDILTLDKDNWIIVKPYSESFTLLPPPFDTGCVEGQGSFCYSKCTINTTISRLNVFPFTEPADESHGNLRILSMLETENASYARIWREIRSECSARCAQVSCRPSITTTLAYNERYPDPEKVVLTASVPGMYFKQVSAVPVTSFIEYVASTTTCISIWFGLSVLSINPFKWINETQRRLLSINKYGRWIYFAFCFIGFTYQLVSITTEFFKFETSSKIQVSTDDEFKYDTLGICFFNTDILNRTEYAKYGLFKTSREAYDHWPEEHSRLTTKEIFMLTPTPEDIFWGCTFRDDFHYNSVKYDREKCQNFLQVQKVLRGETMCYMFIPPATEKISWTKVATSFESQGKVYSIRLKFQKKPNMVVTFMSFLGFKRWALPVLSRNFANIVSLESTNVVLASSTLNTFTSLPAPRDTNCKNFNVEFCNKVCFERKAMSYLKRLQFDIYIEDQTLNWKTVSYTDIHNETFASFLLSTQETCKSKCSGTPCYQIVSFTDHSDYYVKSTKEELKVTSMLPKRPALHIISIPSTTSIDFLLYICNCFGIWFGLSFVACDPLLFLVKCRKVAGYLYGVYSESEAQFPLNKVKLQHATRALIWCTCVFGFISQCYSFSHTYFTYKTSSRIEIINLDNFRLPNIILCTRYKEVIPPETWALNMNITLQPTIRQILEMTPETNSTIIGCRYGFNGSDLFLQGTPDECLQIWRIRKYASGAYICYAYISRPYETYSVNFVTSALTDVGIIYELDLSNSLSPMKHLYLMSDSHPLGLEADSQAILPIRSRKYGEAIYKESNNNQRNYFLIQGIIYNVTLLPAPYDTKCLPDNRADFCGPDCNTDYKRNRLKRVPFHEIMEDPLDLKMVSHEDLMNDTISNIIREGNEMCRKKCSQPPCDSYYTLTDAGGHFKPKIEKNRVVLAAGVSRANGLIVRTFPAILLMDFLNNLGISASIWFGVSVFSLVMMPVEVSSSWKQRRRPKLRKRIHRRQRMQRLHRQSRVGPKGYCKCLYCQMYLKE